MVYLFYSFISFLISLFFILYPPTYTEPDHGKTVSLEDAFRQEIHQMLPIKHHHYRYSNNTTQVTISFAGDCTLGYDDTFSYMHSFPQVLEIQNNHYGYFFEKVQTLFERDDLTLVNLETTFTNATRKANKKYRFKGPPEYVQVLTEGSIEMVNVSNNHIYDYLQEGFEDTIKTLEDAGIYYSGEDHMAIYEAKGIKIASLGYGGWNDSIRNSLEKDIKKAREAADMVIVSFHWGQERSYYPNNTQIYLGRLSIDLGADVVIGHHPHVIQGIEKYKDKHIIYSLGNFSFGGNKNPSDQDTFIFQNTFYFRNKTLVRNEGKIIPCSISSVKIGNNYQPVILEDQERDRVLSRIDEYSRRLQYGIDIYDKNSPFPARVN